MPSDPESMSRAVVLGALVLVASALAFAGCSTDSSGASPTTNASSSRITTVTLTSPVYRPKAPAGTTDDYHCTLLNPHLKRNSYVISSQFFPGSPEDHHAGLFLLPPSLVAEAEKANVGGKGWTCFGEAGLPNEPINELGSTPFLSVWAPGHGVDDLPKGTGIELPAGTMVIMQVHYNLLVGDKPVTNRLVVKTVPMSTPLLPLKLDLSFAAPDLPCPAGVTGPLCNRAASLAHQGQEFGPTAHHIRQRHRSGLRSQSIRSAVWGLDIVHLPGVQQWVHRPIPSPYAPARRQLQARPEPGHTSGQDGP